MATEEDMNAASTTNVRPDGGKKNHKGKKHQKGSEEMLLDPTLSEVLTSHPPSTTEASDDDRGEKPIDVTPGEEWIAKVETARQAVEILADHSTSLVEIADQLGDPSFGSFITVLLYHSASSCFGSLGDIVLLCETAWRHADCSFSLPI
ncbi:hypothetical protein H5410_022997 [Solanum commersonii]|uniref:Uncharacterized protein n=1 Tax=Solanum commersonii TaxID=4109 RepID=A0A9J5ZIZ8_SOLCO|nr:hypothetical protein H5410_022997 [Solanum commersonii]